MNGHGSSKVRGLRQCAPRPVVVAALEIVGIVVVVVVVMGAGSDGGGCGGNGGR